MLNFENDVSPIGGWLTKSEGVFLYEIAKYMSPDTPIIEVGSWKGRSTICLGKGSIEGNKVPVYAIDPHTGSSEHRKFFGIVDTFEQFNLNIKRAAIGPQIRVMKMTSEDAARQVKEEVSFVFVDGAHEYEFVKSDYLLWFPKLKEHSSMAFHDCWHALGVHLFTAQLLLTSSYIRNPRLVDTMTVVEKTEKNTMVERIENVAFFLYRLFFGWIGTIKINFPGLTPM